MASKENSWLKKAADAYDTSTTYVDTNYRTQWENNLRMFQSKHPIGSKYNSDAYKYRSKGFRPKTRSVIRNNESAAAAAFFSSMDTVTVEPFNEKNKRQKASAALRNELLEYRLQHTIPWYLTLVGGMQDAQTHGVVASYQYWDTEKDIPVVELIPIENVRIDPAASWIDPVNTSPYVILRFAMYISDIKENKEFHNITDAQLSTAKSDDLDTTRQARNNNREDPNDAKHSGELTDFDTVWVHLNIMSSGKSDVVYWTLGTTALLTDPKPLEDEYWHGERPVTIGMAIIETHKIFPAGVAELGQGLQQEANEINNQRRDNVKLVLNKHWFVKRGTQVPIKTLTRNVPGSVTLLNDMGDVKSEDFNDVTSSSYAEQDRINADYDELTGSFSAGSVQTNRSLNETVGGLNILKSGSNGLTQYLIQVFSETWVEKVLRQLDKLEQYYESDEELLLMIADKLNFEEKYGITRIDSSLFFERAEVTVNIANSATDPTIRLEQLLFAVAKYTEIVASAPPDMDVREIGKEIFGRLGYKDGRRFYKEDDTEQDPEKMQLIQMVEQLQGAIEGKQLELQAKSQETLQLAQFQANNENQRLAATLQSNENIKQLELQGKQSTELDKTNTVESMKKYIADLGSDTQLAIAKGSHVLNRDKFSQEVKEHQEENQGNQDERQAVLDLSGQVKGEVVEIAEFIEEDKKERDQNKQAVLAYLATRTENNPELKKLIDNLQ